MSGIGGKANAGQPADGEGSAPKPNIPQDEVPEAFRNLPEPGPKGEVLYTYTYEPWRGTIMETGPKQGRLWSTVHPPGPWAYATDPYHTAVRAWRTGHTDPFVAWRAIEGEARQKFTKPLALGPLRGWKRAAGQNYTNTPGNLDLDTAEFVPATDWQKERMRADKWGSHGFDVVVAGGGLATPGGLFYAGQRKERLPPLPPNEQSRPKQYPEKPSEDR